MAAVVAATVVALALITAAVVYLTGGGSGAGDTAEGKPSAGQTPSPSGEPSEPSQQPSEDGEATDFPTPGEGGDVPSGDPDGGASDVPLPAFLLHEGDCYNRSKEREGAVVTRDCDQSHDAEVVSRKKLTGSYGTDDAVRREADSACRTLLRNKAAKQPRGTVGGTLITYPKAKNAGEGFSYVVCSLTAGKGKKLSKPLT